MEESKEALEKLKVAVNGGREFLEQSGTLPLEYVADSVCSVLRDVLKDLCLLIEERHKVGHSEKDKLVIHYTSFATLVSILHAFKSDENSSLRLYDSVHLNDPDEGKYLSRNLSLPKKYDWLREYDLLEEKEGILEEKEGTHAYITSFIIPNSKKDMSNNLVFWRTYGDEGKGCSLSLPVPRSRLQKVLYGAKEVKRTVKVLSPALQALYPLVKACKERLRKDVSEKLAEIFWKALERFRYLYKSEAYEYEDECRFVIAESDIPDKNKICFEYQDRSSSPVRIRHYYEPEELGIKKLLVTDSLITLGPCVRPHPDNVRYYLETLLRRATLEGPEVRISKIPYRES